MNLLSTSRGLVGFRGLSKTVTGASTDAPWRKPRCRIPSQQKCWITSSATYTTHKIPSGTVASSPNRGSRAPDNTFSPPSVSPPQRPCSYGRRCSRTLQHLPRVTPKLYPLTAPRSLQLWMRNWAVGSEVFLVSFCLEVERCALYPGGSRFSLVPFHGISPVIKSLRVAVSTLPFSHIFDLILSFPLLDDLAVMVYQTPGESGDDSEEGEIPTAAQPSSSPMFTGSLEVDLSRGMRTFTHRLSSLPGGTHFRNLALTWNHGG
jgi:hypothetical protein